MRYLALFLFATTALGQSLNYVPPRTSAYVSSTGVSGSWNPLTGSGGSNPLDYVPPAAALYYSSDGTGNSGTWRPWNGTSVGGGTVTSVGLTVPSWLSVAGSPVTGAGVLAVTPTTAQTSHLVIGTCNAATAFGPCALVAGDLPSTAVTPGTYTNASLTVDQQGRLTAASSGTAGTTVTVASGSTALGTAAINTASCATVVSPTATGVASTDAIIWNANATLTTVTGFIPATTGGLSIAAYPTANAVNFDVCNWTASTVTPGAITINWRVVR